jgi:phospholipase C
MRKKIAAMNRTILIACIAAAGPACAAPAATTPIEHVIVIVGENRSFDNLYGTYTPP